MPLQAGAPASVEREQQDTSESAAAPEEVVSLPKCRWTDCNATMASETDANSHKRASKLGGCIEV